MTGQPVPPPGDHGGDAVRIAAWLQRPVEDVLDLSATLNPVAPDLGPVLADSRAAVRRYPDPSAATTALAAALDVDPERVVLTNGGAEAIALVAALQPVGDVVEPEFGLYRRHLAAVVPGAPRWRSNPSNPLGTLAPPDARAAVWDEAFYPLAAGRWTRGDADTWRLGSLTKVWACPGLRLGYVIAPDGERAAAVRHRQPRWSVNGLALAVAEALLPVSDPAAWTAELAILRRELVDELTRRGVGVGAADAPWVLVHRPGLRDALAPHGVVVRDCTSFGLPGVFRVAVPDADGRRWLLTAVDAVTA